MSSRLAIDLANWNMSSRHPDELIGKRICLALNAGPKGAPCRQKALSVDSDFCQTHSLELQNLTETYQASEREVERLEWTPEITHDTEQMLHLTEAMATIMKLRNQARVKFPPRGRDSTTHAQYILALQADINRMWEGIPSSEDARPVEGTLTGKPSRTHM